MTRITMTGGPVAFYYDQDGAQRARIVKPAMRAAERDALYAKWQQAVATAQTFRADAE